MDEELRPGEAPAGGHAAGGDGDPIAEREPPDTAPENEPAGPLADVAAGPPEAESVPVPRAANDHVPPTQPTAGVEPDEPMPATPAVPDAISVADDTPAKPGLESPAAEPISEAESSIPAFVGAGPEVSRRRFLGFGLVIVAGLAGGTGATRLFPIVEDGGPAPAPIVPGYDAATKAWTFVVDTSRCIGCGLCVAACKEENHVPEEPRYNRTWVERHVTTTDGSLYVDSPDAGIHGFPLGSTAPGAAGKTVTAAFFEPRLCMQCENPPCTTVCPVSATFATPDGVILVDAERCIGCGYCVTACPYGARYIVPAGAGSPMNTPGVADKCTWCYHRITRGGRPVCVEICPVGARLFGDRNDPTSRVAAVVRGQHPEMLHPEYGTRPRVLYLGSATREG